MICLVQGHEKTDVEIPHSQKYAYSSDPVGGVGPPCLLSKNKGTAIWRHPERQTARVISRAVMQLAVKLVEAWIGPGICVGERDIEVHDKKYMPSK